MTDAPEELKKTIRHRIETKDWEKQPRWTILRDRESTLTPGEEAIEMDGLDEKLASIDRQLASLDRKGALIAEVLLGMLFVLLAHVIHHW